MENLSGRHRRLHVDAGYDSAENHGLCASGAASSPTSVGPTCRTAPGSARSAAWSGTIACDCWPTSGWISTTFSAPPNETMPNHISNFIDKFGRVSAEALKVSEGLPVDAQFPTGACRHQSRRPDVVSMGVARTRRCRQGRGRPTAVGGDTPVTGRVGVAPTDDDLPGRGQREIVAAGEPSGLPSRPHRPDGRVTADPTRPDPRTSAPRPTTPWPSTRPGSAGSPSPAGSTAPAGAGPGSRW